MIIVMLYLRYNINVDILIVVQCRWIHIYYVILLTCPLYLIVILSLHGCIARINKEIKTR
jgi:hypothetical protein